MLGIRDTRAHLDCLVHVHFHIKCGARLQREGDKSQQPGRQPYGFYHRKINQVWDSLRGKEEVGMCLCRYFLNSGNIALWLVHFNPDPSSGRLNPLVFSVVDELKRSPWCFWILLPRKSSKAMMLRQVTFPTGNSHAQLETLCIIGWSLNPIGLDAALERLAPWVQNGGQL